MRPDTYTASCHKLWLSYKLFAHGFGTVTLLRAMWYLPVLQLNWFLPFLLTKDSLSVILVWADLNMLQTSWVSLGFWEGPKCSAVKERTCSETQNENIAKRNATRYSFYLDYLGCNCWKPKLCVCVCVFSEIQGKALVRKVSEQMEGGWEANRKWMLDDFLMLCWQQ